MEVDSVLDVEGGKGMGSRIFVGSVVWTEVALFSIGDSGRKLGARTSRKMSLVKGLIMGILAGNVAVFVSGSLGELGLVTASLGLGGMMKMGMGVLVGHVQRWIIVLFDILLCRRIVRVSLAFRHIGVVWYRHEIDKVSCTGKRQEEREVSGINKVG